MIKSAKYIFIFTLLLACRQENLSDLRENTPILTSIIEAGSPRAEVKLFALGVEHASAPINIVNAELSISSPNGNTTQLDYQNGVYLSSENAINFQPNNTYKVLARVSGEDVTALCTIPPAISLLNASNTTFTINKNTLGTPAFILSWTPLNPDNYSYLLVLENLEENPVEIPFNVPSGNFTDQFSGPWEFDGATIYDTDFKYYGHHKLKVMAIEKSVEAVYFYGPSDLRGLLQNGPDNVEGGRGYVFGVSSFTIDLWVQ